MLKIYYLTNKSIKKKNIHVPFLYVITFKKIYGELTLSQVEEVKT